jgi:putative ABC transport system permease protein
MLYRLIFSALQRQKFSTSLLVLQIAVACAVLANACFLAAARFNALRIPSGIAETTLGSLRIDGFDNSRAADLNARVLNAVQGVAGVEGVGIVNMVPFGNLASRAGAFLDADRQHVGGVLDFYQGNPEATTLLGLRASVGRLPGPEDYKPVEQGTPRDPVVVVTRAVAERFWPGQSPLGQRFWAFSTSFTVIGVLDHLAVVQPGMEESADSEMAVFVPAAPGAGLVGTYLVKASPQRLADAMVAVQRAVQAALPEAVIDVDQTRSIEELRASYFKGSRVVLTLLLSVIVALLGTTALSIVGLASFWVTTRRRQIGIQRALGATTSHILQRFQIENLLIVASGAVVGMVGAYGLNILLVKSYEFRPLPPLYLLIGTVLILILGQLAVLAPAIRASRVTPLSAIKS